jgi:signal transduction histidine kinase
MDEQMTDPDPSARIAALEKQVASLAKINKVLMDRVERVTDNVDGNSYALFEYNTILRHNVERQTWELNERNRQLREALQNLQNASDQMIQHEKLAALGSLVAGIAHEVNTPLGIGVTAASHLEEANRALARLFETGAMKKSDLAAFIATCTESARIILGNLTRAADLIQSFKKIAVDQSSEVRQTILLGEYLHDIMVSLTPKLKKTKIKVDIHCPETLKINTLPGSLTQVVANFVTNSLLHAFEPEEAGNIRIDARAKDKSLALTYSDDGKGISHEHQAKIFEPFFTTRRGQGGSGLGLHLVYNIVTNSLGGAIRCESETGQGTKFIITMPNCVVT